MHTSLRVQLAVLAFVWALASPRPAAAQDQPEVDLMATHVAGTIHLIHGTDDAKAFSGGNIAVSVGQDGILMVDTKMDRLAAKIQEQLRKLGHATPRFILNTHVHGDHTGGNAMFESTVIAHTNVRKRLVAEPADAKKWPIITFDEALTFHFNGEEIQALHFPHGHTDGDLVVFFTGSKVVHMGDHMFAQLFPYVDLSNGGDVAGYITNIKSVMQRLPDDVKVIPGHGPLSTKADLHGYVRMLEETTARVREQMQAGKGLDAIKANGLQEEWKAYSWRFISTERWIETIYNSYTEKGAK
jgi:glyoxylase-like metal-dependent hydrolase (beta-lactamase superfamily II)